MIVAFTAFFLERNSKSSSLGYYGYPDSLCTSVNEEVVHGIPGKRILQKGDADILALRVESERRNVHAHEFPSRLL